MRIYISATVMQLEHLRDNGIVKMWETLAGLNFGMAPQWRDSQGEDDEEVLEFELTQLALNECRAAHVEIYPDQEITQDFTRVVLVAEHPDLWVRILEAEMAVALFSQDLKLEYVKAIFVGFTDDAQDLSWFAPTEIESALEFCRA